MDLWQYLEKQGELDLLDELKTKSFDISTSRRGFAILRLREEGLYNEFIRHIETIYPEADFMINEAINKYHKYEAVPEAEYVDLTYKGKTRFTPAEIKALKFYVYELIDPDSGEVFYVGKGWGNRVYSHLKKAIKGDPSEKADKIRKILQKGQKPELNIVDSGMTEEEAYDLEGKLIDKYGIDNLTNVQRGQQQITTDNNSYDELYES